MGKNSRSNIPRILKKEKKLILSIYQSSVSFLSSNKFLLLRKVYCVLYTLASSFILIHTLWASWEAYIICTCTGHKVVNKKTYDWGKLAKHTHTTIAKFHNAH